MYLCRCMCTLAFFAALRHDEPTLLAVPQLRLSLPVTQNTYARIMHGALIFLSFSPRELCARVAASVVSNPVLGLE